MSEFTTAAKNNNNPFFKAMDGQTVTENGHLAVSSGKGGGVRKFQTLMEKSLKLYLLIFFHKLLETKITMNFERKLESFLMLYIKITKIQKRSLLYERPLQVYDEYS